MPARNLRFFLPTFLITLVIDQVTKAWILDRFAYGERLTLIEGFFNLTHVRNPGGAFSFLATLPEEIRQVFFLGTGCLAIVLLLLFLWKLEPGQWLAAIAVGGVLGGAVGNLTDRVLYGEVIDFLDFRLIGGYVWPTFNMADCWIVGGVGILMLEMFFEADPEPPAEDSGIPSDLASEANGPPTA
ncbi:MAG: signal peptidase II [bacterium]|nr:signal peptidase II [bacterium]